MNETTHTKTTAEEHAEREHAERSSSQLGSLALCAGFRPKQTKKIHWVTAQGNRGHAALDSGDDSDLESDFEALMVRRAERYSRSLPLASREFQEMRIETIEGRWGYTDRLRIRAKCAGSLQDLVEGSWQVADSDEADLLDWKFVAKDHVVDAEINLQGKDYVVGIFKDPQFAFLNTIHVHFVETRFDEVTTATYTRDDIPRLELEIYAVLMRARNTDRCDFDTATLKPHYDTCKYCARAGVDCRALDNIADALGRAYDPEEYGKTPELPKEVHSSKAKDPVVRAQLQDLAGLMEVYSKSVRHNNLQAALDNEKDTPTGYEIDWSKGKRYVTSHDALRLVAKEFGLTDSDLVECSTVGWTKLEKLLKLRAPSGKKSSAVEDFGNRLVELGATERPEPTPKLRKVHTE
jgi:hypothetical protein